MPTDSATPTARSARRRLKRLIDDQTAERSDEMYVQDREAIQKLARSAVEAFDDKKSQMNKLERMALSASTFGTIADYVKSQMGRDTETGDAWAEDFGETLLDKLDEHRRSVPNDTERLLSAMDGSLVAQLVGGEEENEEDSDGPPERIRRTVSRRLRLGYAQAFVGHVVAEYDYKVSIQADQS
jgi:hypothetical protein